MILPVAGRIKRLASLTVGLGLLACAAPDPFSNHVQNCMGAGHAPGSASFALCMSTAAIGLAASSNEEQERRRWHARLLREQLDAEARARQERAMVGLNR